mmetsp:Transcript_67612/g.133442  ORF Transcript_67612/g.133442 Transcript_67612/m.133442 type:complete len:236 (-) Transcript_67612:73-780(-)|eukprot:CAMPEP_0172660162 /NCGR_PEP_ID=MMETSP1074-20121228/3924_1 /TAXON_ID=2916 /ORGANISM="Ceratium fusus, Strain PA161109" /LENGTH=235 /DNA_ID=CAMNT_0013475767 /DNA_START=96 /DNA_END=803 /DNA_ORIENTATION=+
MSNTFATEEDRVNCPFYFKIGACRNGDRCNRAHVRPQVSQTLLLPHLYPNIPDSLSIANDEDWDDDMYARAQEHVEAFYEEVFMELSNYGEIEELVVLDNVSDHMTGNVYCKYYREEAAERAQKKLAGRFYGSRLIQAEYSPVTDFREARCRTFHETRCARGGLCNFMHVKHIPKAVKRRVTRDTVAERKREQRDGGQKRKRQTSEERRAMIAQWNKERQKELARQTTTIVPFTS